MPSSSREVRVRGDANFYSDDTLTWLETHRAQYAIVARPTAPLKRRVTSSANYFPVKNGPDSTR